MITESAISARELWPIGGHRTRRWRVDSALSFEPGYCKIAGPASRKHERERPSQTITIDCSVLALVQFGADRIQGWKKTRF